jgi:aminoglycoside phosphotransferase (APT) family kinase protein
VDSVTKNRQSPETLQAMVARAYGAEQIPTGDDWVTELGVGLFNAAYRLRLRDGYQSVLKIAPPTDVEVMTYERGAMATELAALALVREHTGVPVPHVDYADQSRELCDADYFFMSYVEGDNLSVVKEGLPQDQRVAYGEALGATTRELNSIRGPVFGALDGSGSSSWRQTFVDMVEDVLADGERRYVDLGWSYDTIRLVLAQNAECLDEVTDPRFVEWDLWDGNVMVRNGRIVGILDHERAFYGDPLIEHGFNAADLPAFGDPAAFLRGYGKTEFTPTERLRRHLYCLHLSLIMVIETVYRELEDPQPYEWARERLDETMSLLRLTAPN